MLHKQIPFSPEGRNPVSTNCGRHEVPRGENLLQLVAV
jgi:hypothetical protein